MVSLLGKVLNTNKNSESVHFSDIMVAQQAGGDFDVVDREDLDGNDSSVEDASDMVSDVEK